MYYSFYSVLITRLFLIFSSNTNSQVYYVFQLFTYSESWFFISDGKVSFMVFISELSLTASQFCMCTISIMVICQGTIVHHGWYVGVTMLKEEDILAIFQDNLCIMIHVLIFLRGHDPVSCKVIMVFSFQKMYELIWLCYLSMIGKIFKDWVLNRFI